jgi:hypothetical protein
MAAATLLEAGIDFEDFFYPADGDSIAGDAEFLNGGQGGNDYFSGASGAYGYMAVGDAFEMGGRAQGGNDLMIGGNGVNTSSPAPVVFASGLDFTPADVTSLDVYFGSGGVQYAGDAVYMYQRAQGGDDTLVGGYNSQNLLAGDALYTMYDRTAGGNDVILGGSGVDGYAINLAMGDAAELGYGNFLSGPDAAATSKSLESGSVSGGADYISGGDAISMDGQAEVANFYLGDGYAIYARGQGGDDEIHGGSAYAQYSSAGSISADAVNFVAGDGYALTGQSHGGDDAMYGGSSWSDGGDAYAVNFMAGDAFGMMANAKAGDDFMVGGDAHGASGIDAGTLNIMAGDSWYAEANKMGDDTLLGGNGESGGAQVVNVLYGDVGSFSGGPFVPTIAEASAPSASASVRAAAYGDDSLVGGHGNAENFLVGDTQEMYGGRGGDDTLEGGGFGTQNILVGDALYLYGRAAGGSDLLVSHEGNDDMWGDGMLQDAARGRADIFKFSPNNGTDIIEDFRVRDRDQIDLKDFRGESSDFRNFDSLLHSGRLENVDGGVLLHLSGFLGRDEVDTSIYIEEDTVFLVGVTVADLTAASFVL